MRCRADRAVDGTFDLLGHRNVSVRRSDRLASRSVERDPCADASLEPDPVSRSGHRRRLQAAVGSEPPSALRHARPGVRLLARFAICRRVRRAALELDRGQSAATRRELGEQSRGVVSRDLVAVGAAALRGGAAADGCAAGDGARVAAAAREAHRALPVDLLQPEHASHRRGARAAVPRHRAPDLRGGGVVAPARVEHPARSAVPSGATGRQLLRAGALLPPVHGGHLSPRASCWRMRTAGRGTRRCASGWSGWTNSSCTRCIPTAPFLSSGTTTAAA